MRIAPRLLLLAALSYIFVVLVMHAHALWNIPSDSEGYDPTKVVLYFMAIVALSVVIGLVFALGVLPVIGDRIGNFFFTPNQQIEKDPHADALAFYNQGEYAGAVAAYRNAASKNPSDTHAISEAARILCDRLDQPHEAKDYLLEVLENEWSMDERAFLAERLVDVFWLKLQDAESSLPILAQIAEEMPSTTHSANANHRTRVIEEALFKKQAALAAQAEAPADSAGDEPEAPLESTEEEPENS